MKTWLTVIAAAAALVGSSNLVFAQSAETLPVPGYDAARDVPGSYELPDPGMVHKVVFDVATGAATVDEVNPWLPAIARYVNTLAKHGVPAENRKVAVVLHQGSTEIILDNETFKEHNDGADNPNIELIQNLANAG
ncbi:MAG TPA: hypothetical protein QF901_09540, partial [Gammaproteobacteria bacterium]|nr:hypothetical protein [Gammaproteobacteria bacterium]